MKAVVQRVARASVTVNGERVAAISKGFVVLLGIKKGDDVADARYMASKIAGLRIFEDDQGKMNLSIKDVKGSVLLVSQFTLYGDCRRGRRPSFTMAADGCEAKPLYEEFGRELDRQGVPVEYGRFGASMVVEIINEGPVTIILDSDET
ncbi:MAG TPA: D-tyrosyl-tRNA(Tyr) deacylase [Clostridia bacterium]|nr:D-tyrosyl-tRNA(Tyr) deacylase [Clostridia bacterium]